MLEGRKRVLKDIAYIRFFMNMFVYIILKNLGANNFYYLYGTYVALPPETTFNFLKFVPFQLVVYIQKSLALYIFYECAIKTGKLTTGHSNLQAFL